MATPFAAGRLAGLLAAAAVSLGSFVPHAVAAATPGAPAVPAPAADETQIAQGYWTPGPSPQQGRWYQPPQHQFQFQFNWPGFGWANPGHQPPQWQPPRHQPPRYVQPGWNDPRGGQQARLSGHQLRNILAGQGWDDIRVIRSDTWTFTVRAEDRWNRDRVLTVNAYTGRILQVSRG